MLKKTFNKLKTPTLSIETENSSEDLQDIDSNLISTLSLKQEQVREIID